MDQNKKLFAEFPPIVTEQWEERINADLKGGDYERTLIWKTSEGFNVRPYYRSEDLDKINYLDVLPQQFPFVRGSKTERNTWFIRQDIEVNSAFEANKKAYDLLSKGVNAFGFIVNKSLTQADLSTLIQGLPLAEVEINFVAGHGALELAKMLNEIEIDQSIRGSLAFDPLMYLAKAGKFKNDNPMAEAASVVQLLSDFPNFKAITIWGDLFENAGSTMVQELGFSLAVANEYLAALTDAGLTVDQVANAIKFQFGTGSNYFMEIAKIRAARLLWAKIVEAYQPEIPEVASADIHAITSDWNKSIYDPYVNMLRTQTEAMSSILGGVNSMTVKSFNTSYEKPTDFSERIARNQQLLLKEESHFDKVVDPAAGSYYIESLTDSIAEQAWKLFTEVETKGGFVAAYKSGFIPSIIKEAAQKRDMDLANRKEILLGVNQYPNFTESIKIDLAPQWLQKPVMAKSDAEPLVTYRGAMAFEALRYKTDVFAKKNKRPLAFMIPMGNLNMRKARTQFACNFFAVAGFEVLDNNGFETVAEGIAAALKAKADIVVICSSDEEYATLAPEVKMMAGETITVVAGYPKAILDDLKAAGIEHFIHVKSNLLETLTGFQKELKIV